MTLDKTYIFLNSKEFLSNSVFFREEFSEFIEHVVHSFKKTLFKLFEVGFICFLVNITLHLGYSLFNLLRELIVVQA